MYRVTVRIAGRVVKRARLALTSDTVTLTAAGH
jgi:hypothetical protein